MLRTLLVSLVAAARRPRERARRRDSSASGGYKDRTTEIMLGIIFVLMIGMVLIGVLEGRGKH